MLHGQVPGLNIRVSHLGREQKLAAVLREIGVLGRIIGRREWIHRSQTFTTKISDPNGATNLSDLLFFVSNNWTGPYCFADYDGLANLLYLWNDAGTARTGGFAPGSTGSVSTSRCTLSGAGSSVSKVGNTVTLNLALTFQPVFTGTWNINISAWDVSGQNSGYQLKGSWTVPSSSQPPTISSLMPNSGTGLSQTFTMTVSEPDGATAIAGVYFYVGNGWDARGMKTATI